MTDESDYTPELDDEIEDDLPFDVIECPYCSSPDVEYKPVGDVYRCLDCLEYFEDDVPGIESVEREERTKLNREF